MKTMPCFREEEVVAAVISGNLDGLLSGHVASCESCRTATNVTSLLQGEPVGKKIADVPSSNMIWTRATVIMRARRKRMQRLGMSISIVSGTLAGYLTSLVIWPSGTELSLDRAAVLLARALVLLLPTVIVLAAVWLIVYSANPADPKKVILSYSEPK